MPWEQQSPINVKATFKSKAPRNYLRLNWLGAANGFCVDGHHGVDVIFEPQSANYLELAGKKFTLRSFHFHHPAEHLIDGSLYDGEVHLVHQNLDDCTLAVVGVCLKVDMSLSATTTQFETCFTDAKDSKLQCCFPLEPKDWLPDKLDRILRYEGSLTTPPYTESVSWIVFPEPKSISPRLFQAVFGTKPQEARPIQPLNRRYVLDLAVTISISKAEPEIMAKEKPTR